MKEKVGDDVSRRISILGCLGEEESRGNCLKAFLGCSCSNTIMDLTHKYLDTSLLLMRVPLSTYLVVPT